MAAFNNELYLKIQSDKILERIKMFDNKLYLEFGGKIFDDYHAMRVLPGFQRDSKVQMLLEMRERVEIIIVVNAKDIESGKVRADMGITYENEVIRMMSAFKDMNLYVGGVVITQFNNEPNAISFMRKLKTMKVKTYKHYTIPGYPANVDKVLSEDGFGCNEFVKTTRPLVVVTAPGPGSGKMSTCLSQIYHENLNGVKAGYAKFETFPIWNLPLKHPVHLAYEAATADLKDVNMIDPYHLSAYGETTVNYNRDVEIFPILSELFGHIYGESPYKSPTDMGVNMIAYCIEDEEAVRKACEQEIIRRYLIGVTDSKLGKVKDNVVVKLEHIMIQMGTSVENRPCVSAAKAKMEEKKCPVIALTLKDGTMIYGKSSQLLEASAALILNAIKHLANIRDEFPLIPASVIEPIKAIKVNALGNRNPSLVVNDILIALSISAVSNPLASEALKYLDNLRGTEAHASYLLPVDVEITLKKLGINITKETNFDNE